MNVMTRSKLEVIPLSKHIGAEIRGLDLSQPLSEADVAAMRANAVRWQALPAGAGAMSWSRGKDSLQLRLLPGADGDQCLVLQSAQAKEALLRHCSFGLIQTASFSVNREGNAAALAVQPTESWRELWLLRQTPPLA